MTAPAIAAQWLHWPATKAVVDALGADRARFVGGAVRDSWLGAPVSDVDIATPLDPDQVMRKLQAAGLKAIPTGYAHGTITAVAADGKTFEITSLRRDLETDGRHATVAFGGGWQSDAARRDFTINALYADIDGRIFDYHHGLDDLKQGRVRFIGDPDQRLTEDALRLLRFFRFHARFGAGAPDEAGFAACRARAASLQGLSRERVRDEILKLLVAPKARETLELMLHADILASIVPEITTADRLGRLIPLEDAVADVDPLRRLVAVLPADGHIVERVARRLRLSNSDIKRAAAMAEKADATPPLSPQQARAALYQSGVTGFRDQLLLHIASHGRMTESDLEVLWALADAWVRPQMPMNGADLVERGFQAGPAMGAALARAEAAWVASDFTATQADLLAIVTPD